MLEVCKLLRRPPSELESLTDLDHEFLRFALPKGYERWVKTRTA